MFVVFLEFSSFVFIMVYKFLEVLNRFMWFYLFVGIESICVFIDFRGNSSWSLLRRILFGEYGYCVGEVVNEGVGFGYLDKRLKGGFRVVSEFRWVYLVLVFYCSFV